MANGSSRVVVASVVLLVGIAVGWLLFARPALAKSWNIKVGPGPCDLTDDDQGGKKAPLQRLSRGNKDAIKWHSPGNPKLYIVLHFKVTSTCPLPFANLTKIGDDGHGKDLYLVGGGPAAKIDSGPVDGGACYSDPDDPTTWLKYDQYLETSVPGVYQSCDGMIIVEK